VGKGAAGGGGGGCKADGGRGEDTTCAWPSRDPQQIARVRKLIQRK